MCALAATMKLASPTAPSQERPGHRSLSGARPARPVHPRPLSLLRRGYREGYDVVYGQREARQGESVDKVFTAWVFYRVMRFAVYKRLPLDAGDFRLISRACLDGLKSMRETHRFLRGMVAWVGYPKFALQYQRASRVAGETKY